jgi:hypothetical protein
VIKKRKQRLNLFELICEADPDQWERALSILSEQERKTESEKFLTSFIQRGEYEKALALAEKIGRPLREEEKCEMAQIFAIRGKRKEAKEIIKTISSLENKVNALSSLLSQEIREKSEEKKETAKEILDLLLSPSQHLPHTPESY